MIEEIDVNLEQDNITIHDQFQFEIKWAFKFNRAKKFTTYEIETYFFIPQNLGINKVSYQKKDFYNDLKTYIRYKTPTILLRNIAGGPHSLVEDLKKIFVKIAAHPDKELFMEYEDRIKLFCCQFKSALREHVAFINKKTNPADVKMLVEQYIECTTAIAKEYRDLKSILNVPSINEQVFLKYLFGDEYLSLTIEDYTYLLLVSLDKQKTKPDKQLSEKLLGIIKKEIAYRQACSYPSIPQTGSDNEVLVFRKSILKKYMGSILYLNVRTENAGVFIEQLVFGVAAGLSMIFATTVAFLSQKTYGNFSMPLFFALVISYMFKDRIKELLRIYLRDRLDKVLYDHKILLHTKNKKKIGWCKESFNFIPESAVPKNVLQLRNKDHITEIENGWMGEQIILYKKLIRLYSNSFDHLPEDARINSINDIMRFNIEKFLSKMDNPVKPIFVVNETGFKKIFAKRVYHLNLVIKYSVDGRSSFKRFRIILNRKGIRNIEMVNLN